MSIIPQKRCPKCKVEKPLAAFGVDRSTRSGYTSQCRACRAAQTNQNYRADPAKSIQKAKQWVEVNKDRRRAQQAAWYLRNQEQEKERARLWRANNPEKRRAQIRAYYVAKPDKIRTILQRRRARKYQQGGCYTEAQWAALKTQYQFTCLRCRRREPEIRLTADHVIPIARGGSSYIENMQPLCDDCNRWKNVRTVDYR